MRAYVFTDPALARHAGRFVWLALDNEKAQNASVSKRLDVRALPTFFILDPASEQVALRWVGGATVAQLDHMLDDGGRLIAHAAASGAQAKAGASAKADAALARAERLYGAGDNASAAAAYAEALAAAPAGWPQYSRAVESRLFAPTTSDSSQAAANPARDAYPKLESPPPAAHGAAGGAQARPQLPPGPP